MPKNRRVRRLWEDGLLFDFSFDHNAEKKIADALQNDIPYRIESLDFGEPVTFETFQSNIANHTAARIDQISDALMMLHDQKEIEILTPSGQLKKPNALLKNTDRIQLSRQPFIPGFDLPRK